MSADRVYSYSDYLKHFKGDKTAREYWKLFKVRGSLDNRHINFIVCNNCSSNIFNDKNKIKFKVDNDGTIITTIISFDLCENCVSRNVFEVNSYIFKYTTKQIAKAKNTVNIDSSGQIAKKLKSDESVSENNNKAPENLVKLNEDVGTAE